MYRESHININEFYENQSISEILEGKETISKKELESLDLLHRIDCKFIINFSKLPKFLKSLSKDYKILEINNTRQFSYENIYYDTDDFYTYHLHHNKIANRFKIRIRNYLETQTSNLEIKYKNNKKVTYKTIKKLNFGQNEFNEGELHFLNEHLNIETLLLRKIVNINYNRITFANKFNDEKITIDFNISYDDNPKISLPELVIIEHKTNHPKTQKSFEKLVSKFGAQKIKFSKYCFGLFLTNKLVKINSFKHHYLSLLKLIYPGSYYGFNINNRSQYQLDVSRFSH